MIQLSRPFTDDVRIAALATTGVAEWKDEGFTLKINRQHPELDLPLSPYYINLRVEPDGPLTRPQAQLFGQDLGWLTRLVWWDHDGFPDRFQVLGVPNTGKPLAEGFAAIWPEPEKITLVEMWKEGEGKGEYARRISDNADPKVPIVLVDDVITKGGSKFETLDILEDLGFTVPYCVVTVDREQGGRQDLEARGVKLLAATTFSQVLNGCRNLGLITQEMYQRSLDYPAALDAALAKK